MTEWLAGVFLHQTEFLPEKAEVYVDINKINGKSFLHKLNQQLCKDLPNIF